MKLKSLSPKLILLSLLLGLFSHGSIALPQYPSQQVEAAEKPLKTTKRKKIKKFKKKLRKVKPKPGASIWAAIGLLTLVLTFIGSFGLLIAGLFLSWPIWLLILFAGIIAVPGIITTFTLGLILGIGSKLDKRRNGGAFLLIPLAYLGILATSVIGLILSWPIWIMLSLAIALAIPTIIIVLALGLLLGDKKNTPSPVPAPKDNRKKI